MTTSVASQSPDDELRLTLTRVFDATVPLVYSAWTQKEHLDLWSAPPGLTVIQSSGNLFVGGTWHCLMVRDYNGEKFPVGGMYLEIIPNQELVMSHSWLDDDGNSGHETQLSATFTPENAGKTLLTLKQGIFRSKESRDGHCDGWNDCLNLLSELLARLQQKPS